jgi:hypothetical protein
VDNRRQQTEVGTGGLLPPHQAAKLAVAAAETATAGSTAHLEKQNGKEEQKNRLASSCR